MGYESVTDDKIKELIEMKKVVKNANARRLDKGSHYQYNYNVEGAESYSFQLYMRQNKELDDDFSCGLCWLMPSGDVLTLCRYNGSSHNHPNVMEKESLGYNCHIHYATEKYIVANKKPDGYAKVTKNYNTLNGALHCLLKDCNIEGLNSQPDLPTLFD
jgi:hypothetical protein